MNVKKLASLLEALIGDGTKTELAHALGIAPATLGAYTRCGVKEPSVDVLIAIADYMGVSLDSLINQISDKPRPGRVGEACSVYKIASVDELTPFVDNLPPVDKKRLLLYTMEKLAV